MEDFHLVCVQSEPLRDPRKHVIDHVYYVQLPMERFSAAKAADDAAELAHLHFERGKVDLRGDDWAFDHADSLRRFFQDRLGWL
jgi:ADP-ribose pyrophosphatase YjhB (NUDIX family)